MAAMLSAQWQSFIYQAANTGDSRVNRIVGSAVVCLVIAYVSVLLRFVARRIGRSSLQADDWWMLASLVFTTTYFGLILSMVPLGFGRHEVLSGNLRRFMIVGLASEITYCVAFLVVKFSTLLLLRRIFPGRRFAQVLLAIGAVVAAYTIANIVCLLLQCIPLKKIWDLGLEGRCFNLLSVFITCAALNIATDLAMFGIPMPMLWALKVSMWKRVQLMAIFVVGGCVCIISIIRLPELLDFSLIDPTWQDVDFAVWSGFECSIATLCACVPTMRPLLLYVKHSRPVSTTITKLGSRSSIFGSRRSSTEKNLNSVKIPRQDSWKPVYGERSVDIRSLARHEKSEAGIGESDLDELRTLTVSRSGDYTAQRSDPSGIRVQTDLEVSYQEAASRRASHNPV